MSGSAGVQLSVLGSCSHPWPSTMRSVLLVLILGGAVLIGTRDASTPEASIQAGPHTTGSIAGGE